MAETCSSVIKKLCAVARNKTCVYPVHISLPSHSCYMSRPSLSRWRSSPSSYYLLLCFMHNLQILRNRTILPVSMLIHSYYHPFKFTLCTNKLSIPKLIFALLQFLNFYSSIPFLYSHLRNLKKSLTCLSASNFLPQSLRCMLCLPA